MFETTIENGIEEIDIEVHYEYIPYEPSSWDCPGQAEDACICEVFLNNTNVEICLLPNVERDITEDILSQEFDDFDYEPETYNQ